MKQVQEEHLCRDIHRIAQGIERIAGALEKLAVKSGSIEVLKSRKTAEQSNAGIMRNAVVDFCIGIVKKLPSVPPERKTGRWLPDNTDYYRTKFICSVCGESEEVPTTGFGYGTMWGYCPNCGAKMERGEQECAI